MSFFVISNFAQAEIIRNETRIVYAGSYNGWMHTPDASSQIYIRLDVVEDHDITLIVFDSPNYIRWKDGLSASKELVVYNKKSTEVSCDLVTGVPYYIILDNQDSIINVHVLVTIQDEPFFGSTTTLGSNKRWISLGIAGAILFPGILGTTILFAKSTKSSTHKEEAGKPLQIEEYSVDSKSTKETNKRFKICSNCNGSGYFGENYCSFCGCKY